MLVDALAAPARAAPRSKLPHKTRFIEGADSTTRQALAARPLVEPAQMAPADDQPSDHGYDEYLENFF